MTAPQRNKYGARTVVKASLPTGEALIDRILTDLYGRTYRPPAPPKKTTSRTRSTKPTTPKPAPLSADEAIRQLQAVTTADGAREILSQMKKLVAGFKQVADSFGVVYGKSPTTAVLTNGIVDMVMAARRFEPLQRGGMR